MLQCLYIKLSCSASILPGLSIRGIKDLFANVKMNYELAQNCPFFLQRDCLLWEDPIHWEDRCKTDVQVSLNFSHRPAKCTASLTRYFEVEHRTTFCFPSPTQLKKHFIPRHVLNFTSFTKCFYSEKHAWQKRKRITFSFRKVRENRRCIYEE